MKRVLFLGIPKGTRCTDKVYCQDITEVFSKVLEIVPDQNQLGQFIAEQEGFRITDHVGCILIIRKNKR